MKNRDCNVHHTGGAPCQVCTTTGYNPTALLFSLVSRIQDADTLVCWHLSIYDLDALIKQPPGCWAICGIRALGLLRGVRVDVGDVGEDVWEACIVWPIIEHASFACRHISHFDQNQPYHDWGAGFGIQGSLLP